MGRLRLTALFAAVMVAAPAGAALAADYIPPTPIPADHAWYVRGHIGMAGQHFSGLEHPDFDIPAYFEWLQTGQFDAVPIFGIGFGFSKGQMRFDFTGEYRGKSAFSALDRYDTLGDGDLPLFDGSPGGDWGTNHYTAKKSEWLFLANGYFDIGSWHGITPYVGGGIGAAQVTIHDFLDDNVPAGGQGYAATASQWNLAWAIHAGAGIQVTHNMTVDFGYSFVHLGNGTTGSFVNVDPSQPCLTAGCPPVTFAGIYSHDMKVAVRWALGDAYY